MVTDDNIIRSMCFACWTSKATDTHLEYIILTAFQGRNGYANSFRCYLMRKFSVLLNSHFVTYFLDFHMQYLRTGERWTKQTAKYTYSEIHDWPVEMTLPFYWMTNFTHISFFMYFYFNSLHVSSIQVLIIRRFDCISTISGICHSM